ncbi:phosphopyruvate hydratase [Candidatus Uhrbacteria bacterium]|nr:phosphopyruvate hydratase [Candidatus Uhrbacteria bacterium]
MKNTIERIHAHEILDSRGNPTLSVSVLLHDGTIGSASVPSGASTGLHEASELRDGNKKRYGGKGVLKALANIKKIENALAGLSVVHQQEIDEVMCALDGTRNKSRLGANAILGVSLACAHTAAKAKHLPLYAYLRSTYKLPVTSYKFPLPMMNLLNGGAHAGWAADVQESMVVPQMRRFADRVRAGSEIFHALGALLKERGILPLVGDEGGYVFPKSTTADALDLLLAAIKKTGYRAGKEITLAVDVAASEMYDKKSKKYVFVVEGKTRTRQDMLVWYGELTKRYPLVSIEDPLAEDDWDGWAEATRKLQGMIVVGDDFFVTSTERLRKGIEIGAANAILIKPNQIGTLSETMDAITLARANGYKVIISHRSGETSDTTIADLAVAVNAEYIKTGSLSRGERVAKYNRLMEIEEETRGM